MLISDRIEVWNLTSEKYATIGAQSIFNVVGCFKSPQKPEQLFYSLNNAPPKKIYYNVNQNRCGRLEYFGYFNIDTINALELNPLNQIIFFIQNGTNWKKECEINFPIRIYDDKLHNFNLNLDNVSNPEEMGQVVDGNWKINRDNVGKLCLEISKKEAGLDRIILFGNQNWTHGYEITAKICITSWTRMIHNVGLLFKWNPHRQGDGTALPTEWSTGLGYYYSHCLGLRIRYGVNVHFDENGNKIGDYILEEAKLSYWRWILSKFIVNRKLGKFLFQRDPFSQIIPNKHYRYRLLIQSDVYALTVWKDGKSEPPPQIVIQQPKHRLPCGATGIIAHNCGVRVYEYKVSPK